MARAPLDPEAHALWQRVVETVRPLKGRRAALKSPGNKPSDPAMRPALGEARAASSAIAARVSHPLRSTGVVLAQRSADPRISQARNTLDGGWDDRLRRGTVSPDVTVDLHGFTLAAAHAELEIGLARAVARQARLILLVTGRPPPPGRSRLDNPLRGVIRASVGDWLHHSQNAAHIAAVRNAHPRHGGAGALYVILRRRREPL